LYFNCTSIVYISKSMNNNVLKEVYEALQRQLGSSSSSSSGSGSGSGSGSSSKTQSDVRQFFK